MNTLDDLLSDEKEVLAFLKSKFPLYHLSNFFLRDIQYGLREFCEKKKGTKVSYSDGEKLAREFAGMLEKRKIFIPIDNQSWVVNYPEFKTPVTKAPPAAAKPPLPPRPVPAPAIGEEGKVVSPIAPAPVPEAKNE